MNPLHFIRALFDHSQQPQQQAQAPQQIQTVLNGQPYNYGGDPMGAAGNFKVGDIPLTYQQNGLTFAAPRQRQFEDASLINGQQGFSPINADIFNTFTPLGGLGQNTLDINQLQGNYDNPQATLFSPYMQQGGIPQSNGRIFEDAPSYAQDIYQQQTPDILRIIQQVYRGLR